MENNIITTTIADRTWFTADLHFSHANIIKYCQRPFKDTVEMNETIIANWNRVVGKDDVVYDLGDFCLGGHGKIGDYVFESVFNRLNGCHIFIEGNHDNIARRHRKRFYAYHDARHEVEIDGQYIVLSHYSHVVWNKSHRNSYHLFGHSHGTLPDNPHSLSFDVGVDCHNYTPINLTQVRQIMAKKCYRPVDHHGGLSKDDYAKQQRRILLDSLKREFEPETVTNN